MADERIIVSRNKLEAIVAALKEKTGEEDGYTLDQMPDAIRAISGGGGGYADGILTQVIVMPKPIITADWTWIQ